MPSVINGKRPMNVMMRSVSGIFPSNEFETEGPFVGDAALEALFSQHTQLNFSHIQPRTMRGREMEAQPSSNAIRLSFAKSFNQSQIRMGVEIIQNHINAASVRVQTIDQIAHGESEIPFGAAVSDEGKAFPGFRFSTYEQIARAVALIFMVFPARMPGSHPNR